MLCKAACVQIASRFWVYVIVIMGIVCGLTGKGCLQVPSSPLLPAALPALLSALTGACQQGGDAALAKRLQALLMAFTKGQAQSSPSASGHYLALVLKHYQHA